ncbi:multicopper oxidase domain-containing protein [Kitasatospora sp. NPDC018058]|uniref:multicopper oxidase domain-containing protein n=1 Tax=Kitasatospora sp. NPDC018058 TaxID=3364025 RepID=UPI0037C0497D
MPGRAAVVGVESGLLLVPGLDGEGEDRRSGRVVELPAEGVVAARQPTGRGRRADRRPVRRAFVPPARARAGGGMPVAAPSCQSGARPAGGGPGEPRRGRRRCFCTTTRRTLSRCRAASGTFHHPVHLHLNHFRVLSRNGASPGRFDAGWKDTVDLRPAEAVELVVRFTDYAGRFMLHCHNLEHEDMAMMGDFVTA